MYSPPTASPWSRRNSSSRTGAASPIVSAPGSTPMKKDGNAMARTDQISACFRPNRSPTQPNSAPPTGRITNPAAKVPNAASNEAVGFPAGKKCAPICWAKNPKRAKSYHSSMFPTTPATTPRRTARGVRNSWVITSGGVIGIEVAVMAAPWASLRLGPFGRRRKESVEPEVDRELAVVSAPVLDRGEHRLRARELAAPIRHRCSELRVVHAGQRRLAELERLPQPADHLLLRRSRVQPGPPGQRLPADLRAEIVVQLGDVED